jgi:L-ribulose-5-phosphate 4-epimerase
MSLQALKQQVVLANKELPKQQLVKYSWGNVSAIDTSGDVIVIKPVGMPYDELTEENISVVDRDGKVLGGPFNPSVDLDIHRALYLHFQGAKAIVHTHSTYATVLAQLRKPVPCYGTTHADYFYGTVPCVDDLTKEEVEGAFEWNTGMAIVSYFERNRINPMDVPAALSPFHGVFTWGTDVWDAVHKAVVLEEICKMAVCMQAIQPHPDELPSFMLDRHYLRKHGANAYFTHDDYGAGMVTR